MQKGSVLVSDFTSEKEKQAFMKSLENAFETVCGDFGLSFGGVRGWMSDDGLVLLNMSAHVENFDKYCAQMYLKNADDIGLSPDWLNTSVRNPETNRVLKVVGLDVDGGDKCVRVEAEEGGRFRISPAQLSTLMIGV
jgi:hypothetical protein